MAKKYPIITTRGVIVFPETEKIIEVGRPKSILALHESSKKFANQLIIVSQRNSELDDVTEISQIYDFGILVNIQFDNSSKEDGEKIIVHGLKRVKLSNVDFDGEYIVGEIKELTDVKGDAKDEEALKRAILNQIQNTAHLNHIIPKNILNDLSTKLEGAQISNLIANYLPIDINKKQSLLEELSINERLRLITKYLEEEKEITEIEKTIDASMRKSLDAQQREFLLRERLKAIKEDLGEISSKERETEEMMKKATSGILPNSIEEKIVEEIKKYESMPSMAAESNVSKSFIEWVLKMPWKVFSKDSESLPTAKRILNADHYGLDKIKERIIEFLAVKLNTKSTNAPIICFVGPPGVGKTSLAQSIARAMNRTFVKVSLGGLRDEAEIRGHRRTYVGAMPGKIIAGIAKTKVNNPLMLLDEIDKMSSDYKGDPTSAMLEVLDPEQNKTFQDHYLEFEYDLSNVVFVCTANYYQNIPEPLLDRMEIIELSSYTETEKVNIAKKHLIPKTLKNNGLSKKQFAISDETLRFIISYYTLESGVRSLIRALDKIARKLVVKKLNNKLGETNEMTKEQVIELLGTPIFDKDLKDLKPQVGAVTGLAFTQYGGSTIPIEATMVPGKGNLKLTGQLKDVMSESANIALSYVKANAKKFGITTNFAKYDIHIHAAAGAIPKDGPSAGVTFTTAIISMLKNKPVSQDVAMTGEVTLRGHVLPIGGLKEKSLAALRHGVTTVFIPKQNKKNLKDFDKEIVKNLTFVSVENYIDIYNSLFA